MFKNDLIFGLFRNSLKFKTKIVFNQSLRNHFKFSLTQNKQQINVFHKLLKKNKDFEALNKVFNNNRVIVSKGSPTDRENRRPKDDNRRLITRRMSVLNKLLMQSMSDVLSTEQIGDDFNELQVRITQVKVNNRCDSLNVYWVSKCEDTERVSEMLDQMKGRLHQHLMDRNLMNSIPWIQFVLDVNENHCQQLDSILRKCDFGPDFRPSDMTLFETPYEVMSRSNGKSVKKLDQNFENNEKVYEYLKLQKPLDMKMNCFGVEYEVLINNVLMNLHKSRAQHRSFNAVADPLPPPDWSNPLPVNPNPESDTTYNTEQRIQAMKKFLVENRKKREKLSRNMKRLVILEEMQINCHLTDAFEKFEDNVQQFEEEMSQDLDSSFDSEIDLNDNKSNDF